MTCFSVVMWCGAEDGGEREMKRREKVMSAEYRIEERKCATCRWWNGGRGVEFRMNRPYYVKVGNSNSTCMAKSNGQASAATICPKWMRWEKI